MPDCPAVCGGPFTDPATLPADVRLIRRRHGCDEPCEQAQYVILCPECDGVRPNDCESCESEGKLRGYKLMRRCPASFQTLDVSLAMRAYYMMEKGFLPADGGLMDQPAPFMQFCRILGNELARIKAEQDRADRKKG